MELEKLKKGDILIVTPIGRPESRWAKPLTWHACMVLHEKGSTTSVGCETLLFGRYILIGGVCDHIGLNAEWKIVSRLKPITK